MTTIIVPVCRNSMGQKCRKYARARKNRIILKEDEHPTRQSAKGCTVFSKQKRSKDNISNTNKQSH